ncbi:hypothetical protein ACILG0_04975 [Pseudomonadota bacterium AL_CKDN230030165-1A_HGKHYDSX7]
MFRFPASRPGAVTALLALALATATGTVRADNDLDCPELAQAFAKTYFAFPELKTNTIERLVTWRASCAAKAPKGDGNVRALCQADLPEGGQVFYWIKTGVNAESSGYQICDE